eukprot:1158954-Pelagomonas_calceolata.AAC.2
MCAHMLQYRHPELVAEPVYHQLADRTLDFLQEKLEVGFPLLQNVAIKSKMQLCAFVEDHDIEGSDVEYGVSPGVRACERKGTTKKWA